MNRVGGVYCPPVFLYRGDLMNITLYTNFYKKENSTKQPNPGVGHLETATVVSGILKEPCSVMDPVVQFTPDVFNANADPHLFTYAQIVKFNRYYFVEDWTWNDGLWSCRMTEDVLATYKTLIGATDEYILRTDSDTTDFNGAITDTVYPTTTDFDIEHTAFQNPFQTELEHGCYIVGVIGDDDGVGAINYYALDENEFSAFKTALLTNSNLNQMDLYDAQTGQWLVTDMSQEIFKTQYNPFQYVVSCMWFPIDPISIYGSYDHTIPMGWWKYNLNGLRLLDSTVVFTEFGQIPVHPNAATRGKYLNYSPYTRRTLYGKFGSLPVDTAYSEIGDYLIGYYTVDLITGQCLYELFIAEDSTGTNRKLINKTEFLLGTPIQIAQIGVDYLGTVNTAMGSVGDVLQGASMGGMIGGPVGAGVGAIIGGLAGIGNSIAAALPQMQTNGANGSFINMALSTVLITQFFIPVDEDIHHKGRPLCEIRKINTLSGYVLCAEGDIDLTGYDYERKEINRYLTSGFFWE